LPKIKKHKFINFPWDSKIDRKKSKKNLLMVDKNKILKHDNIVCQIEGRKLLVKR